METKLSILVRIRETILDEALSVFQLDQVPLLFLLGFHRLFLFLPNDARRWWAFESSQIRRHFIFDGGSASTSSILPA
jgi:hypothetical protein